MTLLGLPPPHSSHSMLLLSLIIMCIRKQCGNGAEILPLIYTQPGLGIQWNMTIVCVHMRANVTHYHTSKFVCYLCKTAYCNFGALTCKEQNAGSKWA